MKEKEIIETGALSRYDLSSYSYRQLQKDHICFKEKYAKKYGNNFICRILINYMNYAQEYFLDSFEKEIKEYLSNRKPKDYCESDRISFTKELTNKMSEFDFVGLDTFKKRSAINYILEKFTSLPLAEREKIFFLDYYRKISEAIEKNKMLILKNSSINKEFEIKPYRLEIDDNSLSYYLIGYSRERGSDNEFECYSNKLCRIKECYIRNIEYTLSFSEKNNAEKLLEKFGAAYMFKNRSIKEIERSVIRLTEKGYNDLYLRIIAHQRPIPIDEPKEIIINGTKFYELEFDCSFDQIKNYFFSFGKEAIAISPPDLKESFINRYRDAMENYGDTFPTNK